LQALPNVLSPALAPTTTARSILHDAHQESPAYHLLLDTSSTNIDPVCLNPARPKLRSPVSTRFSNGNPSP